MVLLLLAAGSGVWLLRQFNNFLHDDEDIARLTASLAGPNSKQSGLRRSALRGTIYDQHLRELAVSYQLFAVQAQRDELADQEAEAAELALVLGMDKNVLLQRMQANETVVTLADNLNYEQAAQAAALQLSGIRLQPSEGRYYPGHAVAGHLLGFVSKGIGLSGTEALCDSLLHPGEFRKAEVQGINFAGQNIFGPQAADVILTIDINLQKELEQHLSTYRKATEAAFSSALVLDIENGRLLAAVRQPSFDPNYFWKTQEEDNRLFPETFSFELLRPVLAKATAVQKAGIIGVVPPDLVSRPDQGLNRDKLVASWREFGFDQPEPELLPLVAAPPSKPEDKKMSAMQVALGAAVLFNSGKRVHPWLLKSVYDPDQDRLFTHDLQANMPERLLPPAVGVLLRQSLLHHSRWSKENGFLFLSKTVFAEDAADGADAHHIQELLLAVAPQENPRLLLVLAVDYGRLQPSPPGETEMQTWTRLESLGQSLLPLLAEYAAEKVSPTAKPPVEKNETNMRRFFLSRQLSLQPKETDKIETSSGQRIMPDLLGLSLRKGLQRLNFCKLKVRIRGSGKIIAQDPAAGTSLRKIKTCTLTLAPAPVRWLRPTPKRRLR